MQVGDFVKGLPESDARYGITTSKMTKAVVTKIDGDVITLKILEHEHGGSGTYTVEAKYFEVTGHQKSFNREEVLELLKNGCKKAILDYDLQGADLRGADLREADLREAILRGAILRGAILQGAILQGADLQGADLREADLREAILRGAILRGAILWEAILREAILREADLQEADLREADLRGAILQGADLQGAILQGADLDFSCLPLKCGGLKWKIDKRLACQLAYHLCSMQCDDAEYIRMRNSILGFANQFHRVGECGTLIPVAEPEQKAEE